MHESVRLSTVYIYDTSAFEAVSLPHIYLVLALLPDSHAFEF